MNEWECRKARRRRKEWIIDVLAIAAILAAIGVAYSIASQPIPATRHRKEQPQPAAQHLAANQQDQDDAVLAELLAAEALKRARQEVKP